ncbi:Protein WHAT'S THIS FACTOR 1-like protein, partial [Bienertia sinuspersici]
NHPKTFWKKGEKFQLFLSSPKTTQSTPLPLLLSCKTLTPKNSIFSQKPQFSISVNSCLRSSFLGKVDLGHDNIGFAELGKPMSQFFQLAVVKRRKELPFDNVFKE